MKKVLSLMVLLVTLGFAEEDTWSYVCSKDEVFMLMPKNAQVIGANEDIGYLYDKDSVTIDRKRKTITAWITYYAIIGGTAEHTFSVYKLKKKYSYADDSVATLSYNKYGCDSRYIAGDNDPKALLEPMVPQSVDYSIYSDILNTFKVK